MDKEIIKGLKFGLGFLGIVFTSMLVLFGLVYAVGFHSASEVLSGTFVGNYVFQDNVTFEGNVEGAIPSGSLLRFGDSCPSNFTQVSNNTSISVVPSMTSNTQPSGVASASSSHESYPPYLAFNGVENNHGWISLSSQTTGWIQYDFEEPKFITNYTIIGPTSSINTRAPNTWNLEIWNGTSWQIVDSRSSETFSGSYDSNSYSVSSPSFSTSYRLNTISNNGDPDYLQIDELKYFEKKVFCIRD